MSALAAPLAGFETTPKPRLAGVGQASKTVHDQWIRAHRDAVAPMSRQPIWQRLADLGQFDPAPPARDVAARLPQPPR